MPKKIILRAGDTVVPAVLNDTVAAKDFEKRMPFKVTAHRSAVDYCGTAASGVFDPSETRSGWKNGDISLAGGWFAVLFDGEDKSGSYHGMMPIAHIDQADLPLVKAMPETVKFVVEYAR